jgi:hypothetical protein
MADTLVIDGATVTVDGHAITYGMTSTNANQFAVVGSIAAAPDLRVNQVAIVVPAYIPNLSPMRINQAAIVGPIAKTVDLQIDQLALICVVSPNRRVVTPNRAIGLECWQPCLSYGTNALVYWKGAR